MNIMEPASNRVRSAIMARCLLISDAINLSSWTPLDSGSDVEPPDWSDDVTVQRQSYD